MMKARNQKTPPAVIALVTVLMVTFWVFFAPMQFGGNAAYIIVNGNSMEPLYHRYDMVVLRRSDNPQVGDVFAYRQPEIGIVIHRIIGRDGEKFLFQGDHNSWVDSYRPVQAELVGKAWIHLPGAGQTLLTLRQPWVLALMVAFVGGFLMIGVVKDPSEDKKSSKRRLKFNFGGVMPPLQGKPGETVLFILPVVFILFVIIAFFAFRTPANLVSSNQLGFAHLFVYDYTASTGSELFDGGLIHAPQPVFLRLACKMDVTLGYNFAAVLPVTASGTYNVVARLGEYSGWSHDFELVPETSFDGTNFSKRFTVDICAIRDLADEFNTSTGVQRSVFTLDIIPTVKIQGSLADFPLTEEIAPPLHFSLEPLQLSLLSAEGGASSLTYKKDGNISLSGQVVNTFSLFGWQLPVLFFRILALTGIFGSLIGMVLLGLPLYQSIRQDAIQAIRTKYEPVLVRVQASPQPKLPRVDVASMDDLARLSQNTGQPIFELELSDANEYLVLHEQVVYRYVAARKPAQEELA